MTLKLKIKDRFNKDLPADPILENSRRQVREACFSYVTPKIPSNPSLIHTSPEMLDNLGISKADSLTSDFLNVVTGAKILPNTKPYAMCYAGHQFGNWAGQLGDGRAINLAEIKHNNNYWALQLKGAGETPYSRSADGLAVLRSSIREYLCSEAMHHLGVPTTRALSLSLSGDKVLRDMMYNGNPDYEKGAIVARVAPSFLRFGSYEIFTSRGDDNTLKTLVDYTIKNHYVHLGVPSKDVYIAFMREVSKRSMDMVIHWQRVGFVHGVMNTDNMSILGLTIDYGPYGWLEGYDHGVQVAYIKMMRSKLGLQNETEDDMALIEELEKILQESETDMTIFFRNLANFKTSQLGEWLSVVKDAFYRPTEISDRLKNQWKNWFIKYDKRLVEESWTDERRKVEMNTVNPKYVLRNYMAQLAIDDADKGNYELIDELFNLLKKPYDEQPESEKWFSKRPEWARHKVGCSMLSCSS